MLYIGNLSHNPHPTICYFFLQTLKTILYKAVPEKGILTKVSDLDLLKTFKFKIPF